MRNKYTYNLGIMFAKIAASHPERVALRFLDGTSTTYAQLDSMSDSFATMILNFRKSNSGNVAAILNEKTPQSYAVMLACLKTGTTYTNLDTNSPVERVNRMLSFCQPSIIFYGPNSAEKISSIDTIHANTVNYSLPCPEHDSIPPMPDFDGNTPAYLMFTSGSTGFPKGAVISHANVINFVAWAQDTFRITPDDVLTNLNPMHFDNSVFDFYSSMFSGASMIPVPEDSVKNPRRMLDTLKDLKPTIWFSVPSLLVYSLKMRAIKADDLPSLKTISFGGEGFPKNQLRKLWELWGGRVRFVNVYGPTECTCICSSYEVGEKDMDSDELLPLGPPAPNFNFAVVNEHLEPLPHGETGELCLSGPNVGKGYYNNPQKTAETFIQSPTVKSHLETAYRTGDLVCYDQQSQLLLFRGRRDNQIKRMGYRIELEEIENALGSLPYVEENAVVYLKNNANDNGRIVACLVSTNNDEQLILADLRKLLPPYMIPNDLVFTGCLPKNRNGKIDRLAIKENLSQ